MDRKSHQKQEIQRLIDLGNAARNRLQADISALQHRLDVPARFRESLAKHPTGWMAGSLVSGIATSLFLRRKPAAISKFRLFPTSLVALTLTAARPLLKVWLVGQLKQWATRALSSPRFSPTSSTSAPSSHVETSGPRSR